MDFLQNLLVVIHFIGLAALFGGFFVQMTARDKVINNAMFHGALTQLVTGILLVGVVQHNEPDEIDNAKIGVKLGILVVILALILINRRKKPAPTWVWAAIGLLTIANICVAVFWAVGPSA